MFSLIITIVSIALVVALVAATMYYGGDTLTQGRTQADAAAFVAGAQQITGSASMFTALEGAAPAALQDLVDEDYLSSIPTAEFAAGGEWVLDSANRVLTANVASADVCGVLAEDGGATAGTDGIFGTADDVVPADALYGCQNDGTDNVFTFNY